MRDFFRFGCDKWGLDIIQPLPEVNNPPSQPLALDTEREKKRAEQLAAAPGLLQRWKDGTTGTPLVDANMRELAATGFLSQRGRQASKTLRVCRHGVATWGQRTPGARPLACSRAEGASR